MLLSVRRHRVAERYLTRIQDPSPLVALDPPRRRPLGEGGDAGYPSESSGDLSETRPCLRCGLVFPLAARHGNKKTLGAIIGPPGFYKCNCLTCAKQAFFAYRRRQKAPSPNNAEPKRLSMAGSGTI
jgi:hypothetical protein